MGDEVISSVAEGPGWRLILGNCLDPVTGLASLADKSVDHVITDPPYSEHTHAKVRRGGSVHAADVTTGGPLRPVISSSVALGFDALSPFVRAGVASGLARVVRRWSLMFCDAEGVTDWMRDVVLVGLSHVRIGHWRKLGGSPQFTGDRPGIGCEAIEIAHPPGRKRWNGGGRHAFWEFAIASGTRVHTTQKPLPLMEALVSDFTDAGELICDPFAGSGTTGVACIRLGRRFVGWEKDPRYFAVAVKRLRAAREQLRMALVVEPMGTQAALLPASPSTQEAP